MCARIATNNIYYLSLMLTINLLVNIVNFILQIKQSKYGEVKGEHLCMLCNKLSAWQL